MGKHTEHCCSSERGIKTEIHYFCLSLSGELLGWDFGKWVLLHTQAFSSGKKGNKIGYITAFSSSLSLLNGGRLDRNPGVCTKASARSWEWRRERKRQKGKKTQCRLRSCCAIAAHSSLPGTRKERPLWQLPCAPPRQGLEPGADGLRQQHSAPVYAAPYLNALLKGGFCFECSCQCLLLTGNQYIICFLESRHLSFRTRSAKFSAGGKLSSFDLTSLSLWMSLSLPRGREMSEKRKEWTQGYKLYLILPMDELPALKFLEWCWQCRNSRAS